MRHSDPRLTMRVYTDERQIYVASEVAKLPDFALKLGKWSAASESPKVSVSEIR